MSKATHPRLVPLFLVPIVLAIFQQPAMGRTVIESAREIPVAYEVDVIVAGGSSAGVAAAVHAAESGASVFLAAPRPYLGEDLCATYRLWLEPGAEPQTELAKALFREPAAAPVMGESLPFAYTASLPSEEAHKDNPDAPMLSDGRWSSAPSESVQYGGDVSITADLGATRRFERVHLLAFHRLGDFVVRRARLFASDDGAEWRPIAVLENEHADFGGTGGGAVDLAAAVDGRARYLRFDVERQPGCERVLLGEIVIEESVSDGKTAARRPPTPMNVKRALDRALLDAGVEFLYSCAPTDVLRDESGRPAGIVMANRSGRQAVLGKVIIDAMERAPVARMAGAEFSPYPAGTHMFKRIVLGGEDRDGTGPVPAEMPSPVYTGTMGGQSENLTAYEYTLELPMADGSFASFARAEQMARDLTWRPGQAGASETLFQIPPDRMRGRARLEGDWPGAENADLDAFRPAGADGIYVLNGCADVSRGAAESMLNPLEMLALGVRAGAAAAGEAKAAPPLRGVALTGSAEGAEDLGEVRELLSGTRPVSQTEKTVPSEIRGIPVLAGYDVVVVGGGTGGAPAGIGAARRGAKTLVIEYLHGLGGVGTLGLIGNYYYGYREGFTKELDEGLAAMDGGGGRVSRGWDVEKKMEWYRRELREAGADIWFGTLGCGALVEDGKVKGVVVATPEGRGAVLAHTLIDSTGSADIAIAAGSDYMFTSAENDALQGTGLPPRQPGANYTNTDYTFTDDTDMVDVWRTLVLAKEKYPNAFDLGQLVDTRERRRIVGDFVISPLDIYNHRTYPDTIGVSSSNFDTHGFTIHPLFMLRPPDKEAISAYTPYRALLPKDLDGIIVTGLGISAHRDAMPILRMQPCIQNQGYAMGVAASMAADAGVSTRDIDLKALQRHLAEKGNIPLRALTDGDSYPYPDELVAEAVRQLAERPDALPENPSRDVRPGSLAERDLDPLGVVLARTEVSVPLMRGALERAETEDARLALAHVLGMLGDGAGGGALVRAVRSREWDEGWSFKGGGQFGASVSPLDSLIIALGRSKNPDALPVLIEKAKKLDGDGEFSHHRAIAMAFEALGDPEAAPVLAELIQKPGIRGHSFSNLERAKQIVPLNASNDNTTRDRSMRELILARALYRCGDSDGLGERILREYAQDLRGHHARHAAAVLGGN